MAMLDECFIAGPCHLLKGQFRESDLEARLPLDDLFGALSAVQQCHVSEHGADARAE